MNKRKLNLIPAQIRRSRIQTYRDTGDMPEYKRQIGWDPSMKYSWLFPITFLWRHFSNPEFWNTLQKLGAVLHNQPPKWTLIEQSMRAFRERDVAYHGGLFYSGSVLTKYRYGSAAKPAEWVHCDGDPSLDFVDKEMLALKVMWHVACLLEDKFNSLQRDPTRQCWTACTEGFFTALKDHTAGVFGHYSIKIMLDGILIVQPHLERVVAWWPMLCNAYKDQLPRLYPAAAKKQEDLFLAGVHFHLHLKRHSPKFYLRDSLAQTCWIERGVTS